MGTLSLIFGGGHGQFVGITRVLTCHVSCTVVELKYTSQFS